LTTVPQPRPLQVSARPQPLADQSEPAEPQASVPHLFAPGALTPDRMLALQRTAGNAQVARILGIGEPKLSDRKLVDKALGPDGTANDAKEIENFGVAEEHEKAPLMDKIMTDRWVGPTGEKALERCWASMGAAALLRFTEKHPDMWRKCVDRGAELEDLPAFRALKDDFLEDVRKVGRHYLRLNLEVVRAEQDKYGIRRAPGGAPAAETAGPADDIAKLQAAAASLASLQQAQEKARDSYVGWRIGDGGDVDADWTGRRVKYQVKFHPKQPPPLFQEPQEEGLPHGSPLLYPQAPYEELKAKYDEGTEHIAGLTATHPALYALSREGKSGATSAFALEKDPVAARAKIGVSLQALVADITKTEQFLDNGRLNPLDLKPLQDQIFAGTAPKVGTRWQKGFARQTGEDMAREHAIDKALAELAYQNVQQLLFLLAPFTGGATLIVLLAASAAAAGTKAVISARDFEAVSTAEKTAVTPGSALVTGAQVDHARQIAEADAVAFVLSALALGGAVANAMAARSQALKRPPAPGTPEPPGTPGARKQGTSLNEFLGDEYDFTKTDTLRDSRNPAHANIIKLRTLALEGIAEAGPNAPVKVVPIHYDIKAAVKGDFTQAKFVAGRTPEQLASELGVSSFKDGVRVYRLDRGAINEGNLNLRGYTQSPAGKAPSLSTPENLTKYPVGAGSTQWNVSQDVPASHVGAFQPGEPVRF
jgi:hypothetical protein